MHFLENYYNNIIKYDLINKFNYKDIKQIPKLQKIVLYFNFKKFNINNIISCLTLFQLITLKKGTLIKSRKFNAALKIRKGNPIGCKITLKKKTMYFFFYKLLIRIFSNPKHFEGLETKYSNFDAFSFKIKNVMIFEGLENHFRYFKDLDGLDVFITTNSKTFEEFIFLFKSFKIPIKNKQM